MVREKEIKDLIDHRFGESASEVLALLATQYDDDSSVSIDEQIRTLFEQVEESGKILSLNVPHQERHDMELGSQPNPPENISFESFSSWMNQIIAYQRQIYSLRDDQISNLYALHWRAETNTVKERRHLLGKEYDKAQFFSEPKADVDREAWMQKAAWTVDEFVAFSLGKAPEIVSAEKLKPFWRVHSSPFREEYERRLDRVSRAAKIGEWTDYMAPKKYIGWARDNEMSIEGIDLLGKDHESNQDRVHGGTLNSLYQLILWTYFELQGSAVVRDKEEFAEDFTKRLLISEIKPKIALSDKTIKKHIDRAVDWAIGKELLTVKDPPNAFRKNPLK